MGKESSVEIVNRLRVLRAERRITQEQLADAAEVTRATINYIENGEYRPSLELAMRLAEYFGMRIEDIFQMKKPEEKK